MGFSGRDTRYDYQAETRNVIYVIGNPTIDTLVHDSTTREALGGTAIYTSLAIRRLGQRVAVVSKGCAAARQVLEDAGVDVSLFTETERCVRFRNVYYKERRHQFAQEGDAISFDELPEHVLRSDALLLGPVLNEVHPIVASLPRMGMIMADMQGFLRALLPTGQISLRVPKELQAAVAHFDIAKCNCNEAYALTGKSHPEEAARAIYAMGCKIAIVTVGKSGSYLCDSSGPIHINAFNTRTLDPTGAGDIYSAAFLVSLLCSNNVRESATFASCAASFVVEDYAYGLIPSKKMVTERLSYSDSAEG
jgi:1D-myo-inositol 3-kinase